MTTDKLVRRLGKTTKRLGVVREFDVLELLIEELRQRGRYSPVALDVVAAATARRRTVATARVKAKVTHSKLRRLAGRLEDVVERLEADEASATAKSSADTRAWRWGLDARLIRRSGQLRAAIEVTGPMYCPGQLHDVRVALKKCRYAFELAQEAGREGSGADLATLRAMQDSLGRLHDLEVLIEWTRDAQASAAPPELATWGLGSLVRDLENECRLLHARYMSHRSKLLGVCDRAAGRRPAVAAPRRAVG